MSNNEILRLEYANSAQFAVGDGRTRLFPLKVGDQEVTPTLIQSVFIYDWQGQPNLATSHARTNVLSYSTGFGPSQNWNPYFANVCKNAPDESGPDGVSGSVSSIRLGDCTGGPTSSIGGVINVEAVPRIEQGTTYVGSIWVRASASLNAMLGVAGQPNAPSFNVGTDWRRISVVYAAAPGTAYALLLAVDQLINAGADPDTVLYFTFAQVEAETQLGMASRYIPTQGSQATSVDYVVNDDNVIFSEPLDNGATAVWTGTGYWVQGESDPIVPAFYLKRGMTWRMDQSPRLNAIIDGKSNWYAQNYNQFWEGWYGSVFRLKSSNTFGVAVWAYILGVPLGVLGLEENYRYWGYGPRRANYRTGWADNTDQPSSGNFPPVGSAGTGAITTQWEKIAALRLRYYALTLNATISNINAALQDVFGDTGFAYVLDNEDMTMTYVFDFPVSLSFQQSMLQYGLLPKPAGVKIKIQAP